ncbi:MFS transporter [Gordonibacter massiliensis (ex Traore et al. 2017)]|uniref:MFS transporter n=1 Tax=Gordonibacter massiliensis (ex Traore et al. 2017) TaxID=1841863 RepID=UPI001C8B8DE1|nr:MFS transporter [Gordonibacter massiliensis (ex Traore et al. 2017)]MBX9033752.1 MFS transporter [Gordonibacter massiliensis (ex Traore et al. 2017)]
MAEAKVYGYRWVILALAFLVHCGLQVAILITMGMGSLMMGPDVGLSVTEFSMISTMPYLTGFLFGIVGGAWADRKSIRVVMISGLSVAVVGGLMRTVSMSFPVLLLASFLLGFALAALNANSAKLFRLWFPGKWTSIAMGIYILGATAGGGAIAMKVGPMLTDPHTGFMIGAGCAIACLVLWIFLGRTYPGGENGGEAAEPMTKYLGVVLKNKYVWIISFVMFCAFGASIVENNFLTAGLVEYTGDPGVAGSVSAANMIAVGVGGVVMPILLGNVKKLKPVFFVAALLMAVTDVLIFWLPFGAITWAMVILQGFFMGVILPMGKTLPALIPGVRPEHLGAVGGIQSSFQNLGAWILPAYIIAPVATSVAGGTPLSLMIGGGIAVALAGVFILFLPSDTGTVVKLEEGKVSE